MGKTFNVLKIIGFIIALLAIILLVIDNIEKPSIKSTDHKTHIYNMTDSLEVFFINEIPYGLVTYIQGVESTKDTTLVRLPPNRQYRMFEMAILNVESMGIFKIQVPVYAINMFEVGKISRPKIMRGNIRPKKKNKLL